MLARATNGFSESQVNAALRGVTRPPQYRVRFELLNRQNEVVQSLTNVNLDASSVDHVAASDIKRTARFQIRESEWMVGAETASQLDYSDLVISHVPLFYLRLGESSGNFADSSGNGRTFTTHGGITYLAPSLLAGQTDNGGIVLNGSTGYLDIADDAWMDVSIAASWEAWIKTSSATTQQIIGRDDGTNKAFQFRVQSTGEILLAFYIGGVIKTFITTAKVNDGLPHHVVGRYTGAHAEIWIDGVRMLKTAQTGNIDAIASKITVGVSTNVIAEFFNGTLDEVAMYNRALSSLEIRQHYRKGAARYAEIEYQQGANSDRIKAYYAIRMDSNGTDGTPWAEWPLGVFLLKNPRRRSTTTGVIVDIDGYDQTVVISEAKVNADRYIVASGTNYATAITTILTTLGFTTSDFTIAATSKTTPETFEWEIDTSYLRLINELLLGINYRNWRFTGAGAGVGEAYALPASRSVDYTYRTDSISPVADEYEQELRDIRVPNQVVVVQANPGSATDDSTSTNTELSNAANTGIRQSTETRRIDVTAADSSTLDDIADRLLTEGTESTTFNFKTLPHPFHDNEDILRFVDAEGDFPLGIDANFIEEEWHLPLKEGDLMTHKCRAVVDVV